MKTQDVPFELREFLKLFNQIAGYKHDYARVYADYLTMAVAYFMPPGDEYRVERDAAMQPYSTAEKKVFGLMFYEMVRVLHRQLGSPIAQPAVQERLRELMDLPRQADPFQGLGRGRDCDWYDFFGDFYQELTSRGKSSLLGQFFTPPEICDLMTQINQAAQPGTGEPHRTLSVHDPTCGSGRTLLSFNSFHPGHHLYAQDIDKMCCHMTVLNFAVHGAVGEVVWGDSLHPDDWRQGWVVNAEINNRAHPWHGIPHVVPLEKENSGIWQYWHHRKEEVAAGRYPPAPATSPLLALFEGDATPPAGAGSRAGGVVPAPAAAPRPRPGFTRQLGLF